MESVSCRTSSTCDWVLKTMKKIYVFLGQVTRKLKNLILKIPMPNCRGEGEGFGFQIFGRFHQIALLPPITSPTFKEYTGRLG